MAILTAINNLRRTLGFPISSGDSERPDESVHVTITQKNAAEKAAMIAMLTPIFHKVGISEQRLIQEDDELQLFIPNHREEGFNRALNELADHMNRSSELKDGLRTLLPIMEAANAIDKIQMFVDFDLSLMSVRLQLLNIPPRLGELLAKMGAEAEVIPALANDDDTLMSLTVTSRNENLDKMADAVKTHVASRTGLKKGVKTKKVITPESLNFTPSDNLREMAAGFPEATLDTLGLRQTVTNPASFVITPEDNAQAFITKYLAYDERIQQINMALRGLEKKRDADETARLQGMRNRVMTAYNPTAPKAMRDEFAEFESKRLLPEMLAAIGKLSDAGPVSPEGLTTIIESLLRGTYYLKLIRDNIKAASDLIDTPRVMDQMVEIIRKEGEDISQEESVRMRVGNIQSIQNELRVIDALREKINVITKTVMQEAKQSRAKD